MILALEPLKFEWTIMEWFYKIGSPFLNFINWFISDIGSMVIPLLVIAVIYWSVDKKKGEELAFATFLGITVNNIFKTLFLAKRPFQYEGKEYLKKIDTDSATGTSFPSGHSQNAGTFYTSFLLNFKKYYVIIICILMMIIVPISRLYLGVHFPRDVVVGLALGIIVAFLSYFLYSKFYKNRLSINIVILCITMPFLFVKNADVDFFKGFGLLAGFIIGTSLEKEEENYSFSFKIKLLRVLIGLLIVGATYILLSLINHASFIQGNNILSRISYTLTYGVIGLTIIHLVPLILRKIFERKEEKHE